MKWGLSQGMLGRARESLAPSLTAVGPNIYLTRTDFFKMVGIAFVAHMLVIGVASLFHEQQVTNIPVRALSFKLGDQDKIAAYGTSTGVGVSSAPAVAAPVMSALASEGGRVTFTPQPTPAPVKTAVTPKPIKTTKIAPPAPRVVTPTYTAPASAPAIAATPQQYVREVGQANTPTTNNPAGYGMKTGAIGGQGLENTQTEQTKREIRQRYEQQITSWVKMHYQYPAEGQGRSGRVVVRMRIDRGGTVRYYAIDQTSGVPSFDAMAIDMIRRANPMPAVPENYSAENLLDFQIPINFTAPQ